MWNQIITLLFGAFIGVLGYLWHRQDKRLDNMDGDLKTKVDKSSCDPSVHVRADIFNLHLNSITRSIDDLKKSSKEDIADVKKSTEDNWEMLNSIMLHFSIKTKKGGQHDRS